MKTAQGWGIVLLACASVCASAQPATKRIAVLEFRGNKVSPEVRGELADQARSGVLEATRGKGIAVMTQESMAAMLKDMGKTGCAEGECEVETARNIGADYVVTGTVLLIDGEVHVSLKLHESAAGNLLATRSMVSAKQSEAIKGLAAVAKELVGEGLGGVAAKRPVGIPLPGDTQVGGGGTDFAVSGETVVVEFISEPAGAVVSVDGELQCKETPCRKGVEAGRHEVTMQKERYETARVTLDAKKGAVAKVVLVPRFAVLTVETKPAGLSLQVDGEPRASGALEVEPGQHEVLVDDPCYAKTGMKVSVAKGKQKSVVLEAQATRSAIKVSLVDEKGNDVEGKVLVDGVEVGTSPGTYKVATCSKRVEVGAGQYRQSAELKLLEKQVAVVKLTVGASGGVAGERKTDSKTGLVWVRLPSGEFLYGCVEGDRNCLERETKPAVKKKVESFWMMETEVTVKAYFACVNAGACAKPGGGDRACNGEEKGQHPVNCVNWNDALAFCKWEGARLPSAEEWEYGAKSGRGVVYAWANEEPTRERANYGQDYISGRGTEEVGSHTNGNSAWGLEDMAGNVLEWTASNYGDDAKELRGGGWYDAPVGLRASYRSWNLAAQRTDDIGFRCAQ